MTDIETIERLEAELLKTPEGVRMTLEERQQLCKNSSYVRVKSNGGAVVLVPAEVLRHRLSVWRKRLAEQTLKALTK